MAGVGLESAYGLAGLDDLLRQRMQDRLKAQAVAEAIRQFNVRAAETQRQHDLNVQIHQGDTAARQHAQEFANQQRQDTLAETARQHNIGAVTQLPAGELQPETAAQVRQTPYAGLLRTAPAEQAAEGAGVFQTRPGELTPPLYQPERNVFAGGPAWQERQLQRGFLQSQGEANRESKAAIEQGRSEQRQSASDTANQLRMLGLQIQQGHLNVQRQGLQDKEDIAKQTKQRQRETVVGGAESSLRAINDLLDPNGQLKSGATWLFGPSRALGRVASTIGGTESANAQAALDQLTGQNVVNLISEMKSQSRTGATGFGQLNAKELALLEQTATRLRNQSISAEQAATELRVLRDKFGAILREPGGGDSNVPGRTRYDINGNVIK